jgi:uncharacterized membrane protein
MRYKLVLCHRMPERSFHYKGKQFPVCARCTGILIGCCTLPLFYFGFIRISLLALISLNIPLLIDGLTQYMGLRESNNKIRLITGILFSFGYCGLVIFLYQTLLESQ